jgi:predicted small lipoprotein YifL
VIVDYQDVSHAVAYTGRRQQVFAGGAADVVGGFLRAFRIRRLLQPVWVRRCWFAVSKLAVWAGFKLEEKWQMKSITSRSCIALVAVVMGLGLAACEKKGPLEKAGEEVDEAVHTLKNGGEETTADKIDDALDKAGKDIEKATK